MLTSPATITAPAHHDQDRRDVEIVNRQGAVVGLTLFAAIIGVLAVYFADEGATVFALITAGEALLRLAEAVGVKAGSRAMRRVAQGHCIVGALIAGMSLPFGIIGLAGVLVLAVVLMGGYGILGDGCVG